LEVVMPKRLKIAYISGPVDAVEVYDTWLKGSSLGYFGDSHMSAFFQVCQDNQHDAYVITTLPGAKSKTQRGTITIANIPDPKHLSGLRYHIAMPLWFVGLLPAIARFRPDLIVATAGQGYWFSLLPFNWFGVKQLPILCCTLWAKYAAPGLPLRTLTALERPYFKHGIEVAIVASEDIAQQLRTTLRGKEPTILTFLAHYSRQQFAAFQPPEFATRPFRIFFAGRVETNKGVYDLITMAQWLKAREPGTYHFDICGDGSQLEPLRQNIAALGLQSMMTCHGFCDRPKMTKLLNASSLVVVPTTTAFEEGFNMVCAEAILAGRPLVTSAVCPALHYVKDAAIEVGPNKVEEYCQAIWEISHDKDLYERKRLACGNLKEQFFDKSNGWGSKFEEALALYFPNTGTQRAAR
jgi:glycogen synthase